VVAFSDPAISARTVDIDTADVVLVVGTDPIHSSPAYDLRIRKAVRRNGTALAVATDRPSALDGGATEVERYAPGQAAGFLRELAAGVASGSDSGIAGLLRGAEEAVIVWGERIGRGESGTEALAALLDLSRALDLAGKAESGLIEIPDVANARGLREAGCLPDAGPGLSETTPGRDVEQIRAGLESGEITSLLLFGVDPLRDFPDTDGWRRALDAAGHIVCFSMTATATTEYADVVFPLESHAEKDGTVTHPEGRLQRVRPSAQRPGDIRAGWMALAELSAAIGHETGIHSAPEAFEAVAAAVPFYGGLSDEKIAGRGIRWQETESANLFAESLAAASPAASNGATASVAEGSVDGGSGGAPGESRPPEPPSSGPDQTLTLGTYRDLWADVTTDLSPALNYLMPAQRLEISVADARRLGLSRGDEVSVRAGETSVNARVALRSALPEGTCFLMEGTIEGNANIFSNSRPATVEIGKPEVKLDLVTAGPAAAGEPEGGEETQ
jgi:NADH-quinone oxidoreductase subunit G